MKHILFFIFTVSFVFSCADNKPVVAEQSLKKFTLALGTWQLQPNETQFEQWEQVENGFLGKAFVVNEKDTVITEVFFLEQVNDSVRLEVQPITDSGMAQPITYILTHQKRSNFVFENPNHNFPQKMTYNFHGKQLEVFYEGKLGRIRQQADFLYKKISQ